MAESRSGQPVVSVKPQSDVYTLLVMVTILALAVAIGLTLYDLMSPEGYNMRLGDIFAPLKDMKSLPPEALEAIP